MGYGTTHVVFKPQDFIYKLIAVVPMPRANLAHGHHPNEWVVYFVKVPWPVAAIRTE